MAKIYFQGTLKHRIKSYLALSAISLKVAARHVLGKPLVKGWSPLFEIGVLFWRHQFNCAFNAADFAQGRAYFDSLITTTGEVLAVTETETLPSQIEGRWMRPDRPRSKVHILYLHGGGYAFRSDISFLYAKTLCGNLQLPLFMPDYRLTPEHCHPAQIEDALSAYRYMLREGITAENLVLIGDSAGGHLVLMLLQALKKHGLPQPALAIGLCPWTDIGSRGDSLTANDKYDLVQGYMAVRFGEWLTGTSGCSREDLSPIYQDYSGLVPLYLQGGGREVLIDMIRDFADVTTAQGAQVMLDIWPDMVHNFQAHGSTHPDSREAFKRLNQIIDLTLDGESHCPPCARTYIPKETAK